jgi:hypothetical protein
VRYTCSGAFTLAMLSMAAGPARAFKGVEEAPAPVRSPEELARWLSREFNYSMTLGGGVHSPDETIRSRSGDCDDFAILASDMLTRIGVENRVLVIRFSGLSAAHAICIWKERGGTYSFISNSELCRTGMDTVEAAVRKFYPDCETIASVDPREYVRRSSSSGGMASKSFHGAELMADLDPRFSTGL